MRATFLSIVLLLFLSACGEETPAVPNAQVQVSMQPTFGSLPFYMDSIYTTQEGYKIKFTELKCYFTLFGNGTHALHQAALLDYRETGNLLFKKEADYALYDQIGFVICVDSSINHLDPSAFPNESDLNISNAGPMHWGWNPGYIFINIEGKVDTLLDAITNPDLSFSFHIGTDTYLQNLQFNDLNWVDIGDQVREFKLKLDLLAFLGQGANSINLSNENLTHTAAGQEALSQKVITNFKNAISPY